MCYQVVQHYTNYELAACLSLWRSAKAARAFANSNPISNPWTTSYQTQAPTCIRFTAGNFCDNYEYRKPVDVLSMGFGRRPAHGVYLNSAYFGKQAWLPRKIYYQQQKALQWTGLYNRGEPIPSNWAWSHARPRPPRNPLKKRLLTNHFVVFVFARCPFGFLSWRVFNIL